MASIDRGHWRMACHIMEYYIVFIKQYTRLTIGLPVNCRAAMARQHFKKAGLDKLATVVEGDAPKKLARPNARR